MKAGFQIIRPAGSNLIFFGANSSIIIGDAETSSA